MSSLQHARKGNMHSLVMHEKEQSQRDMEKAVAQRLLRHCGSQAKFAVHWPMLHLHDPAILWVHLFFADQT